MILKAGGFLSLGYPADLREAVNKTVASWRVFCSLPTAAKQNLPYADDTRGIGYELKDGIGIGIDRKESFDVTLAGQDWLKKNAELIDPIALVFVQDALSLVSKVKPLVLDFAWQAEKAFSMDGFTEEVEQSELCYFIRFIHYFGDREMGEEIAVPHADQSGFTLHLFESAPGLQCLTFDGRWIDMPVSEGETVIIPAMQLQLRSGGKLKALCHRVIATPEPASGGRYSAVCFIQLKETPKYDKARWGRLQRKVSGFNYEMTLGDFAALFKA
ncbi:MAG TPA: 2OG-Fe(II) oxygenase family protein [Candidatus Paceibacterota bacterium]|nr:2OG-Fe(II) oxygenase family protein [Candidatus Paceibacterota bacterium]